MTYIHTGFAVWDGDVNSGLQKESYPQEFDAVEIQLASENMILNPPESILKIAGERTFKSVHSSDKICNKDGIICDLSSNKESDLTFFKYNLLMNFADRIKADLFIIHPCAYQYLDNLFERKNRMEIFYNNFRKLLEEYRKQRYNFNIAVENLEFDKFPATLDEHVLMFNVCKSIAEDTQIPSEKIKMCWDVQHSRHSTKIINEPFNYTRFSSTNCIESLLPGFPEIHKRFFGTSYNEERCNGDQTDITTRFIENYIKDLSIVHLAGNNDITGTHESLVYRNRNGIFPGWSLNVRRAVETLMDHGFNGTFIVEDHNPSLEKKIQSVRTVQQYIIEKLT